MVAVLPSPPLRSLSLPPRSDPRGEGSRGRQSKRQQSGPRTSQIRFPSLPSPSTAGNGRVAPGRKGAEGSAVDGGWGLVGWQGPFFFSQSIFSQLGTTSKDGETVCENDFRMQSRCPPVKIMYFCRPSRAGRVDDRLDKSFLPVCNNLFSSNE